MRNLSRNTHTVYYAGALRETAILDDDGFDTGEKSMTYSTPALVKTPVQFVKTEIAAERIGDVTYDTIRFVIPNPCPIKEDSILWFGRVPNTPYVGTEPQNNYIVKEIKPSLNFTEIIAKLYTTARYSYLVTEDDADLITENGFYLVTEDYVPI